MTRHAAVQVIDIDGWPVAEVETGDRPFAPAQEYGGRLLLFRSLDGWSLLRISHRTGWDANGRRSDGAGWVSVGRYGSLAEVRAALECDGRRGDWRELVRAGAEHDPDLWALWVPVQIDLDLQRSSVHVRELGVHGEGRRQPGWTKNARCLAVRRLEEIGFVVLSSTDEPQTLFPRRLLRLWSDTLVGAAAVAGHRHRADVVVAVDGAGEVFTRTADSTFDPGAHREHAPRPLSDREAQRVEEIRRQGREGSRG